MPAGKRISLGAAFFGCDPAEGHFSPGQQVPDAWLLLLAKTRDKEVLKGVFTSCRAGRDWCLRSACLATLTIDMSTAQASGRAWRRRLAALQSDLSTRSEQRSSGLVISCTREQSTTPAFQLIADMLAASEQAIHSLIFQTPEGQQAAETAALTAFVQRAAPGLVSLGLLQARCGACVLPAPALLPTLEMVHFKLPPGTPESTLAAVLSSIRPYLGQLTHLSIGPGSPDWPDLDSCPWHLLFPPVAAATAAAATVTLPVAEATTTATAAAAASAASSSPTATAAAAAAVAAGPRAAAAASTATAAASSAAAPILEHFSTTYDLTDTLLTTLLHHAPALEKLRVGSLAISQDYSDRQWGMRELTVWFRAWDSDLVQWYEGMYMPTLVRLPVCDHDEPVVVGGFGHLQLYATSEEGLDANVAGRLSDFSFDVSGEVGIFPALSMPKAEHPAAFKSMLQQLADLNIVSDALVVTRGWDWTPDMLRIAAEYASALDHLRMQMFVLCLGPLTDAHLTHTLQLSDHRLIGNFACLDLQSDQHSEAKWPFHGLILRDTVNVADLLRLPRPDETTNAVLWCCKLVIDKRSITEVGVERLCAWLQHVKWTRPEMCGNLRHAATVTLRYPQDDPAMQRAQLQVLRAMQLDINPEIQGNISVTLEGWNLTHTAMDVLREGLPEWASQIDIRDCQFPLAPKAYKRLAQCVPLCYTTWHTEFLMGSKVWASVTKGLNARRGGLGLPQVLVTVPEPDEPVFCPRKVYKHCVVEVRCEAEDSDWDEPE